MKSYLGNHWISLLLVLPFLLLKSSSTAVRLSDTNVYFYTAYQILSGKLLYADIFFTNFPVFPYLSSFYSIISGGSLLFYYFTSSIEVAITSLFIYAIIVYQWKSRIYALSAQALYLFSFIILTTSDHQSGVFAASLFAVISYFFHQRKKNFLTGAFITLSILTKAYFLPLGAAYGLYFLIRDKKAIQSFIIGVLCISFIVLGPFLLFARSDFIANVFEYSLLRGTGIEKSGIIQFFILKDFLLATMLVLNIILLKKYLFFSLVSIFSIVFILLYQDIYYLYLNIMIPFLVLSFPIYQHILSEKMNLQKMVIPSFIFILICFNLTIYITQFRTLQTIPEFEKIIQNIQSNNPAYIYGTNDIAPAVAYTLDRPLLHAIVDTNTNIFRKGLLNAEALTDEAITNHALVIVHGASYPQFTIDQPILDEIVIAEKILSECKILTSHPVRAEGISNRLNFFQC